MSFFIYEFIVFRFVLFLVCWLLSVRMVANFAYILHISYLSVFFSVNIHKNQHFQYFSV